MIVTVLMKTTRTSTIASFFFFFLLVCSSCTVRIASATEHENHLLQYDFTTQACLGGIFENQGSLKQHQPKFALIRNTSTTTCSIVGMGVENTISYSTLVANTLGSSRLDASTSMEPVLEELQNQGPQVEGITLSLWIQPLGDDDDDNSGGSSTIASAPTPILTIGRQNLPSPSTSYGITECDKRMMDFELSVHNGGDIELHYRTNDPFFEPCQRVRLRDFAKIETGGGLYHLAIVLADRHQQIFVNGEPSPVFREPFDSTLSHWNGESLLQLFPSREHVFPWQGRLYQLSLWSELWDEGKVRTAMAQGLPESNPYTIPKLVRMNEDGQTTTSPSLGMGISVNASLSPSSSSSRHQDDDVDPLTFPIVKLPVGFLKFDEGALLRSLNIEHEPISDVLTYLTHLPSHGRLYSSHGTLLVGGADSSTTTIPLEEPSVIFVPASNEHSKLPGSVYTYFEFCVSRSEIFSTSQCESASNVSIVVDPVNDPPVAVIQDDVYMVHEGIVEEQKALYLSGTDVDRDDSIVSIQITSPPRWGYLYLSVSTFRDDGLLHGTLLSKIENNIPGPDAFVEYRFLSADRILQDGAVADSFRFRVQDAGGLWSDEETAHIQVLPALTIGGSDRVLIKGVEGTDITIPLLGKDGSGLNRTVGFFIETLPEVRQGSLFDLSSNHLVDKGTILLPSASNSATGILNVSFSPSPELCAIDHHANVTVGYRLVALGDNGRVRSTSSVYEQLIQIACKMTPLDLHVPKQRIAVKTFRSLMNDTCSGYIFNATETDPELCSEVAIFSNIHISSDKELVDDVIFVSLSSDLGYLTVNREERKHIRSIDDQAEMRQSIRFSTEAKMLNDVLSFLHYQSGDPGEDEIEIKIRHGDCTWNETTDTEYSSEDCFTLRRTIQIEVLPPDSNENENLDPDFPFLPLPFTFTMILLLKFKGKLREKKVLQLEGDEFADEPQNDDTSTEDDDEVRWIQHYDDESGFYYYQNIMDGTVTWDVPGIGEFIPAEEESS